MQRGGGLSLLRSVKSRDSQNGQAETEVIIITGASSGLGETTARHLASLGAAVEFLADLSSSRLPMAEVVRRSRRRQNQSLCQVQCQDLPLLSARQRAGKRIDLARGSSSAGTASGRLHRLLCPVGKGGI